MEIFKIRKSSASASSNVSETYQEVLPSHSSKQKKTIGQQN